MELGESSVYFAFQKSAPDILIVSSLLRNFSGYFEKYCIQMLTGVCVYFTTVKYLLLLGKLEFYWDVTDPLKYFENQKLPVPFSVPQDMLD